MAEIKWGNTDEQNILVLQNNVQNHENLLMGTDKQRGGSGK
jgi:hypothetical protein